CAQGAAANAAMNTDSNCFFTSGSSTRRDWRSAKLAQDHCARVTDACDAGIAGAQTLSICRAQSAGRSVEAPRFAIARLQPPDLGDVRARLLVRRHAAVLRDGTGAGVVRRRGQQRVAFVTRLERLEVFRSGEYRLFR